VLDLRCQLLGHPQQIGNLDAIQPISQGRGDAVPAGLS
jgi:hypothetical protein